MAVELHLGGMLDAGCWMLDADADADAVVEVQCLDYELSRDGMFQSWYQQGGSCRPNIDMLPVMSSLSWWCDPLKHGGRAGASRCTFCTRDGPASVSLFARLRLLISSLPAPSATQRQGTRADPVTLLPLGTFSLSCISSSRHPSRPVHESPTF